MKFFFSLGCTQKYYWKVCKYDIYNTFFITYKTVIYTIETIQPYGFSMRVNSLFLQICKFLKILFLVNIGNKVHANTTIYFMGDKYCDFVTSIPVQI